MSTPRREASIRTSPRFITDKLKSGAIDDRIDVYEDRVNGWFFAPIHRLLETPDFHYAAVNLALGYFEGWEQYNSGQDGQVRMVLEIEWGAPSRPGY